MTPRQWTMENGQRRMENRLTAFDRSSVVGFQFSIGR